MLLVLFTGHLKDITGMTVTFVHNFEVYCSLAVAILHVYVTDWFWLFVELAFCTGIIFHVGWVPTTEPLAIIGAFLQARCLC